MVGTGSGPLDVVIVYGFDSTNNATPPFYRVDKIFWMVQEKMLRNAVGSRPGRLGYVHFWRPNTYTSDMKVVDSGDVEGRGYRTSPIWKRPSCEKKMASGMSEAQKLIGDTRDAVIVFFSDGLVHMGDYFDGAEDFKAQVPVHTFTLGGDGYNQSLRTIAANSAGGTFNPVPVPEHPRESAAFSGLLDNILTNSGEDMPPPREEVSNIGLVTLDAPKYSRDDVGLTEETLTVGLELKATTFAAAREGLDLVAVLDVSTSMEDKMARLKKAMKFVIMKLTDKDRLSIVTFSDQGRVLTNLRSMTPAAQAELGAIVDGLKEGGNTNITDGLEKGLGVIAGRKYKDGDRTPNVFLMSDGEQNRGGDAGQVKLPDEVAVYTFGFGSGADHALLGKIAKKSAGGTFSSCPDGSNLSSPFAKLVGGLTTIVAQNVQLTLKSVPKEVASMDVASGIDYDMKTTQVDDKNEKKITIFFGTLFSGESRKVIVKFALNARNPKDIKGKKKRYDAIIAVAQHKYTAQMEEKKQAAENITIRRTSKPSPGLSADSAELQAEEVRQQVAVAVPQARELSDAGDLVGARYKLQDSLNALENVALDSRDRENMVRVLRDELLKLIKLMANEQDYKTLGRPYALAVESSHGRQRAAGKGEEEKDDQPVYLYDTARMKTCSKQAKDFEENKIDRVPSAADDDKEELDANPYAKDAAPIAMHLDNAIKALQALRKILVPSA
uniref:Uncharacterized protein n=1 Tax=Avena sativa TaxID=4498 RepID=A0ACD5ZQL8_AVESA